MRIYLNVFILCLYFERVHIEDVFECGNLEHVHLL